MLEPKSVAGHYSWKFMQHLKHNFSLENGELAESFTSKYLKLTGFLIGFEVATKPSK